MKNPIITRGIWAAVLATVSICNLPVEAATKPEKTRAAAKLVDETLKREARQGIDDRAALLEPAREQTPRCEPAWWQSGFVYDLKWKEWLKWYEVPPRAAKDVALVAYRKTRDKYRDTADGQLALARWCTNHKLEEQARAHLTRVLELDPDHAEARQRLGYRKLDGRWVDEHEMAQTLALARKASSVAAEWVSRLQKLRDRLVDNNASKREKARAELMALRDPAAADAIDVVFCRQTSDMALLGVDSLKNIQAPEAARVLAWHAVFSPWPEVRHAAAMALQSEEKHDYVPLLIDLAESMGSQTRDTGGSNTTVTSTGPGVCTLYRLDHDVSSYSWITSQRLKEHPYWWNIPNMRFNSVTPGPVAKNTTTSGSQAGASYSVQQREYYSTWNGRLQNRITENKAKVDQQTQTPVGQYAYPANTPPNTDQTQTGPTPYGSESAARNTAPGTALAEATGENGPSSPSQWWDWWYDYNEVYQPRGKHANAADRSISEVSASEDAKPQRGDCLAAGTLVLTETGLTPIENIAIGDRVFCCDAETGCLALKPILRKTVRSAGRLLKIRAGGEEFQASGGHVLWVAGRGWIKARDLGKGMQLHTIRGTVPVESSGPGALQTTFGLVAADFHTFFIGKGMVLTHDNTIRPPTDRIVPGLAGKAVQALENHVGQPEVRRSMGLVTQSAQAW